MTLKYTEVGNAITIEYDPFEDYWYDLIYMVDEQSTLIESYNGGCSDSLYETPPTNVQLADGANGAITSTTAQVASKLNESTQVTATGGTGATATVESSFNLQNGADAASVIRHSYRLGKSPIWNSGYFK